MLRDVVVKMKEVLSHYDITITDIRIGLTYLKKYGYIQSLRQVDYNKVIEAILMFQNLAHLKVDGEMGPKTLKAMTWDRCGMPDYYPTAKQTLSMETLESKWGNRQLTYYIESRDSDLTPETWDAIIEKSFQQWASVCSLEFERVDAKNRANFIMSTGQGARDKFDGPSGTLAWAQLPPSNNYRGQLLCRFDLSETWRRSLQDGRGILLLNVATHEIGHLLGLGHSGINSALMAPFYAPNIWAPQQRDDINRIIKLYGPRVDAPEPTPPPAPETLPAPSELRVLPLGHNATRLFWVDNSTGEDGFEIVRNGKSIGTVGRGVRFATDKNIPAGTYEYKVRAFTSEQYSDWSNIVIVKLGNKIPEPAPVDPNPDRVIISIDGDITDIEIDGYEVRKL